MPYLELVLSGTAQLLLIISLTHVSMLVLEIESEALGSVGKCSTANHQDAPAPFFPSLHFQSTCIIESKVIKQ